MIKTKRILIVGENSSTGLALREELTTLGYTGLLPKAKEDTDWSSSAQTNNYFSKHNPEYVFFLAGKSGGIGMNTRMPATLMLDNLLISVNVITASYNFHVEKMLYLASSCCYPRNCPQPIKPEYLMTGSLEPTNEAYATAKLTGIQLCKAYQQQYGCNFITAIPSNPFGPGDVFDPDNSHVIEALILKMHNARIKNQASAELWGTGKAKRDFIYSKDLASACICVMNKWENPLPVNLGCNTSISIAELAEMIKKVIGFQGKITFDTTKPDGMPLKCLDATQLAALGWEAKHSLEEGISLTYQCWLKQSGK